MNNDTCVDCGKQRKRGQGSTKLRLCSSCYSRQWRANNKTTKPCEWCGTNFEADRKETQYCGFSCAGKYQSTKRDGSEAWQQYQATVQANKKPKAPLLTQDEREAIWRARRSDLRKAYEDQDKQGFFSALSTQRAVHCYPGRLLGVARKNKPWAGWQKPLPPGCMVGHPIPGA